MYNGLIKKLIVGLMMIPGLGASVTAQAAKDSSATPQNSIGFSVSAKIPNNQISHNNSFFDLKMQKGQSQDLQTVIYNTTNRDIQVENAIHTAYTNSSGSIEYVAPTKKFDSSLQYKVSDLTKISGKKTVTVPANGSITVTAQVKMPKQQMNGVLLGGWYFKRVDQKVTGTVKGAMNINNQYSYVIGLKYSSGKIPKPAMELVSVKPGLYDYHKGIMVNLRNPSATIISKLNTQTTITSNNSGKVVKAAAQKGVQMAPNTTFKYPLLLGKTELQAGKYHLKMVVKNKEHRWVFEKNFTISQKDAQKYNHKSLDNNGLNIWWLIAIGALGMLVFGLLVLWLIIFIRKRRQKKTK